MAAAFLTIKSDHCTTEFDKEQFLKLMQENGIKCENCISYTRDGLTGPCSFLKQDIPFIVPFNFFCKGFNPKQYVR